MPACVFVALGVLLKASGLRLATETLFYDWLIIFPAMTVPFAAMTRASGSYVVVGLVLKRKTVKRELRKSSKWSG